MPSYIEIRAIGEASGNQVINTFWYEDAREGTLTTTELEAILTNWETVVRPSLVGFIATNYLMKQEVIQGYDDDWSRMPYLPIIREVSVAGTFAGTPLPPAYAVVVAARVTPIVKGPQIDKYGVRVLRDVRRGYLSISPTVSTMFGSDGRIVPGNMSGANFTNIKNAFKASLAPASLAPTTFRPIRVSKPLKDEVERGYGLISDTAIRTHASTRRSRVAGRGA